MADLTTSQQVLAFLPSLSAAEQTQVAGLVSPASRAIEKACRRKLAYGSYIEFHRPGMSRSIRLKNPPVIPWTVNLRVNLDRIAAISCIDAGAQRATVTMSPTALTLASYSATAPSPTILTLASYATVGLLAAQVNATAGWSMAVNPSYASWLVADLEPNPGALSALGRSVELVAFVRGLSGWAMDNPEVGAIEIMESRPQAFRYPDRAWGGGGFMGTSGGFGFNTDPRVADVRCAYSAGFDTAGVLAPLVPEDLAYAVALTIKAAIDASQFSGTITKGSLGNTSFELGEVMVVPKSALRLIPAYIKRSL